MSRSKKLDIATDKKRWKTRLYWRRVRRVINSFIKNNWMNEREIPNARVIENDYDYCDYKIVNNYKRKIWK